MSGFIGGFVNGFSAVSNVLSLLNSGAVVTIGDVEFQSHEVPERMEWGTTQATTSHDFPGGGRTIDAMGDQAAAITWTGKLGITSGNASARSRQLNEMAIAGNEVVLTWGEFARNVVVKHVEFRQAGDTTGYKITVEVASDPDAGLASQPTALDQLNSDLSASLGFPVGATITSALQGVQTGAALLGALPGGSSVVTALAGSLTNAVGTVQSAGLAAGGLFSSYATQDGNLVAGTSGLGGALAAATSEAGLTGCLGYVRRCAVNVGAL